MRNTKILFAVAAAVVAATPAAAATVASGTMVVNANVLNTCVVTTTPMDVSAGNFKAGFSQTGSVGLWCTNGYAVTVAATSLNSWALKDGTKTINYSLTGLNANFTGTAALTPEARSFSLDFPAQNPAQGNYSDTVTFTLSA